MTETVVLKKEQREGAIKLLGLCLEHPSSYYRHALDTERDIGESYWDRAKGGYVLYEYRATGDWKDRPQNKPSLRIRLSKKRPSSLALELAKHWRYQWISHDVKIHAVALDEIQCKHALLEFRWRDTISQDARYNNYGVRKPLVAGQMRITMEAVSTVANPLFGANLK